jgi:thioredoxin reductase (NADPH)
MTSLHTSMDTVDLIIIGAGIAGMTAALEATDKGLSTVIVEKAMPGGKLFLYQNIRPNQGIDATSSLAFAASWHALLDISSISITYGDVESIHHHDGVFHIALTDTTMKAKAVIVATGYRDKPLMIEGADAFLGQGLSYCAACDGSFFKGKKVATLLEDFSQLEEVIHLQSMVGHLTVLCIPERNAIDLSSIHILEALKGIELYYGVTPVALKGISQVEACTFLHQGQEKTLDISAMFPFLGSIANTECLSSMVTLDQHGFILTDESYQTNVPHLYAIGDVKVNAARLLKTAMDEAVDVVSHLTKVS